jgi:hypothetical protein
MGWEGKGGGGGEYEGECLFQDDRDNDKYNDNNEYNDEEDGKGSRGEADDGGNPTTIAATLFAGRPLAARSGRCQSSTPMLPPPSSTTTMLTTIAAAVGGRHASPLRSILSCWTLLVAVNVTNRG